MSGRKAQKVQQCNERAAEGFKTKLHEEKPDDCFFFYVCASVERLGLIVLVKSKHLKGVCNEK